MLKQAYKLKLLKKERIHDVFHASLLEQDTTRKRRVEETQVELNVGNSKEYKVEAIWNNAVYAKKVGVQSFTRALLLGIIKGLS